MPRVRRSRSEKEKEKDEEGEEMEVEVEFEVEQEDEEMTPPAKKNKSAKRGKKRKQEEAEPVPVMRGQEERGEGEGEECAAAAAAALPPVLPDLTLTRDDDGGLQIGAHYIPPPPPPALTFANDRPRLVITHIDNENFKSYAGQQTLGPFHKSFTSIVGPNGSGKSNVIDSMLFVFGYRAAKIRSKKISVLIHSSEQHTTINSCTVRVHFHEIIDKNTGDEDDFEVIPDSQFSVARTAFRDSTSFYQIDRKRSQFKEVAKLLRDKGVDLDHNRFLILQGEVEQIALMKPKAVGEHDTGMLEFLEDIVGSSRFQEPIELLKTSVSALDDQRTEKLNRVKLVEKEKDELEGPKNAALDYLRLENEIVEKKNVGYQQYLHRCEETIGKVEQKKIEYEEGAKEVLDKVNKITDEKNKKEEEIKVAGKELANTRGQLDEAHEKFKQHELEDVRLREEMKNTNMKRKKLVHLSKQEKEKYEKLQGVPEENKAKITECQDLKQKLLTQVDEEQVNYDKAVETLKAETQVYQDEKEVLETKLIDLKKDLNEKDSDVKVVQQKLDIAQSKEEKEKVRLEQYQVQMEQSETKLAERTVRLETVSGKRPELEKELLDLKQKMKGLQEKEAKYLDVVRKKRSNFEEKRSNLTASKSKGRVHGAIMEQKNIGNIPGIFGRLGDLGAIDQKYDVAISTATGSGLDTILVDNVDTAKQCIVYLRETNIGRANFLALDKTFHWKSKMAAPPQGFPENVPRLFDLVKPQDNKFLSAFYHSMRDTLVAEDQEQARRIAFGAKRYRVVSLGGELMETSGAMSGGGKTVTKGKMGTQVAGDDIDAGTLKRMEDDVRASEEEHRSAAREKTDSEDRMTIVSRELQATSNENEKLQVDIRALAEKAKNLKKQITAQEKVLSSAKTDENVLAELHKEEEKLQKIYDAQKEKVDDISHQVKKLNTKIKEVTGVKLKAISKRLEEARTKLDKVKSEITRLEVGIKSAERDVKKSKDKCESYDAEVQEAEDKMRGQKSKREELEKVGEDVIAVLKGLKIQEAERIALSEELHELMEKLKHSENKFKSRQIEINQTREKFDAEIKEQTKNVAHWKRELKKLKLREVPGEEVDEELEMHSTEALEALDMKQWQYDLNLMEERLGALKVNYAIIEEYKKKEALYLERVSELDDISKRRDVQRKSHDDLRKMRLNEFMEGFSVITGKLKEMYQMITLGGDAELELVDSLDPFTEGIVFSVRPPKKSWKNISNLSGGEKTLSSLALVFALHYYKPTPLYVMDEIDAALDFKNVSIVANYIKERTKNAQFIIISLRSNMFELADRLVGIYKTYNCTKSVTINPPELAKSSAANGESTNATLQQAQAKQQPEQQSGDQTSTVA